MEPVIHEDPKYCWVCFASEEDDIAAEWVQPCKCRGTTKWVHQLCLQRWIDEKQRGNMSTKVTCPQCSTEYLLVFPPFGVFAYVLDVTDGMFYKICPFVAAGVVIGSVYWSAVTYGAVTVMQILGHREALLAMEQSDPLFLLIGLPTIPGMLILSKMLRWEEFIVRMWRRYSGRIPFLKYLFNSDIGQHGALASEESGERLVSLSDPISATRVLCGALILPTISTILGKFLFSNVSSNLQRAVLGGMTFIAIKGVCKIYLKNKQYLRQHNRRVLNYSERVPTTPSEPTPQTNTAQVNQ